MCGIAGLISFRSPSGVDLIAKMTDMLKPRGPDDEGYIATYTQQQPLKVSVLFGDDSTVKNGLRIDQFIAPANLYLGHRRLAILDLSQAGHQPMQLGNHLWIIYNGEIYNYVELRQELQKLGHDFITRTDTEVILAAYEQWGEECVKRFNGDWAFCILDLRRRVLFLSRDRYGIKPLYFFSDQNHFAFASEIKSLLTLPFVNRSLSREKAIHYLVLFCLDHTEGTFYDAISQLRPGHNMLVDLQTGQTKIYPHYTLSYCADLITYDDRKAKEYAYQVRELLFDAVRLRLRADVPIGTCLSGGIDSSAIVAIVAKLLGANGIAARQKTFTASFPGHPIDESRFATVVLNHTRAEGHFIYPSKEMCIAELATLLDHHDEPFGGSAIYAQWAVMCEASRHVKVVLDGQGGDEVFAGYRDYRLSYLANLLARRRGSELLSELWWSAKLSGGLKGAVEEVKLMLFFVLSHSFKLAVYRRRYRDQLELARNQIGLNGQNGFSHLDRKFAPNANELLFHYMATYSLPHLLKYEDRNSMAHSIEARVPFADHRLVDYVFAIPASYKIHQGWTKWLLRLAVKDLLPPEIVWRKDKMGFATPPWISREEVWNAWRKRTFFQSPQPNSWMH